MDSFDAVGKGLVRLLRKRSRLASSSSAMATEALSRRAFERRGLYGRGQPISLKRLVQNLAQFI